MVEKIPGKFFSRESFYIGEKISGENSLGGFVMGGKIQGEVFLSVSSGDKISGEFFFGAGRARKFRVSIRFCQTGREDSERVFVWQKHFGHV